MCFQGVSRVFPGVFPRGSWGFRVFPETNQWYGSAQNCGFSIVLLNEGGVSSATECPFYKFKPRNTLEAGDCVSRLLTDSRLLTASWRSGEILPSLIRLGTVVSWVWTRRENDSSLWKIRLRNIYVGEVPGDTYWHNAYVLRKKLSRSCVSRVFPGCFLGCFRGVPGGSGCFLKQISDMALRRTVGFPLFC